MKTKRLTFDLNQLVQVLTAAKHVTNTCSITNGGLQKFENRWQEMSDQQKRDTLHDIKQVAAFVIKFSHGLKIEVEVEAGK